MAKSRGRKFAEITSPTSGVFDLTSVPTITNAKLQNSAMTLAGSSVSLGGTGVANTDALSEGSSNLYFTDARVQTFLGGGTLAGNVVVPDNRSIYLGSDSDFRMVHNTTNTQLINATGALQITSNGGFAVTGAATFSSTITATGTITGTLATAAQTNITSLGTLSALAISGDLTIADKIIHSGDTDTFFRFAGANDIRIVAGNVEHAAFDGTIVFNQSGADMDLRVESTGNQNMLFVDAGNNRVGIGTNSPGKILDVEGAIRALNTAGSAAAELDITSGATWRFRSNPTSGTNSYGLDIIKGGAGTDVKMTIDSNGNVNIGGSTAANKTLQIKSANNNDGYLSTFGSGYSLQVARDPLTGAFNNTSTAAAAINLFTASADSSIAFYTTTSNNANPTERMRIDKNGNVGIGTAPTSPLHISSAGNRTLLLDFTGGSGSFSWASFKQSGTEKFRIFGDYTSSYLSFYNETSSTHQLTLASNGNVGIGKTNPSAKLHVSGGLKATDLIAHDSTGINLQTDEGTKRLIVTDGGDITIGSTHAGFSGWRVLNVRGASTGGMLNFENSSGTRSYTIANQGTGVRYQTHISGGYHRFETQGNPNYPLYIANSGAVSINDSGTSAHQFKVTSSTMAARFQSGNGGYSSITWTGNAGAQIGSLTTYGGRLYIGSQNSAGTGSNGEIVVKPGTSSSTGGVGTTLGRTPDVSLEVGGPLKIVNNTGAGMISQTHTNMTVANSGKLLINFASIGTMTSGDTIVFTYSAISWKSWFFKIRWSSTGGYMGELWAGGYNNNSDGKTVINPRYYNSGDGGDGASNNTVAGATLAVTRSGQGNTMTLTLNNTHVHPLFEIEYSCGGGEGYPQASRASITVNS